MALRPATPAHFTPLDEPEHLGRPFLFAVVFHAALLAALTVSAVIKSERKPFLGDPNPGSGVAVTAVKTIPIQQRQGQKNFLAHETESVVPQEPVVQRNQKPPEPKQPEKAVGLPDRVIKPQPQPKPVTQYRPQDHYARNQVFSRTAPALVSPQFAVQGGGGVGIGPSSPFGTQFGAYAQQIRDLISQKWNQAGIQAPPTATAIVTIRINRDGSTRITDAQTSGVYQLDTSAKRAILDASPLPPLPPGFPRSDAEVQLLFRLSP